MKSFKMFTAVKTLLIVGTLLSAFTYKATVAPQKIIVDEVVFVTGGAAPALVQNPTPSVLDNLPTSHQKKDTTNRVRWYDSGSSNSHEGYFVRVEKLGQAGQSAVKVLEFKMVLKPENRKVEFYLTSASATAAQKKISVTGKPEKVNKKKIRIKSGNGLKCHLTVDNVQFKVDSIRYGSATNRFRVITFSKDHINQ